MPDPCEIRSKELDPAVNEDFLLFQIEHLDNIIALLFSVFTTFGLIFLVFFYMINNK